MRGKNRRSLVLLLCALCALLVAGVVASSAAAAKSHRVNMKITKPCPTRGTHICGTFNGSPFGKCKMTGTLIIPKATEVWKCKGGNIKFSAIGTTGAANDAKGNWKMKGGTGKYKHIRGSGTFSGKLSTGIFTYKGSAKY